MTLIDRQTINGITVELEKDAPMAPWVVRVSRAGKELNVLGFQYQETAFASMHHECRKAKRGDYNDTQH
jgi:hypothetical protein